MPDGDVGGELVTLGERFAEMIRDAIAGGCARVTVKLELEGLALTAIGDKAGLWIGVPRPIAPAPAPPGWRWAGADTLEQERRALLEDARL